MVGAPLMARSRSEALVISVPFGARRVCARLSFACVVPGRFNRVDHGGDPAHGKTEDVGHEHALFSKLTFCSPRCCKKTQKIIRPRPPDTSSQKNRRRRSSLSAFTHKAAVWRSSSVTRAGANSVSQTSGHAVCARSLSSLSLLSRSRSPSRRCLSLSARVRATHRACTSRVSAHAPRRGRDTSRMPKRRPERSSTSLVSVSSHSHHTTSQAHTLTHRDGTRKTTQRWVGRDILRRGERRQCLK